MDCLGRREGRLVAARVRHDHVEHEPREVGGLALRAADRPRVVGLHGHPDSDCQYPRFDSKYPYFDSRYSYFDSSTRMSIHGALISSIGTAPGDVDWRGAWQCELCSTTRGYDAHTATNLVATHTARYPAQHCIPHGTESLTTWCHVCHDILCATVGAGPPCLSGRGRRRRT